MRTQRLNHAVYQHQYHIVWGTKYRRKYLKEYVREVLTSSFYATAKAYPTLHIHTLNTDRDHVHLHLEVAPSMAVSTAVKLLKGRSSRDLKQRFKFIKVMYPNDSVWSVGYYSSTIGLNEEQIKHYIAWQGHHDHPQQASLAFS